MRKERWGKKYKDKRNWREYNEKLVARGEAYISLDFIETQDKDLEKLNRGKVGAPYVYPECLMVFLAYLHVLLNIDYRGLKGFLRGLSRLISFDVPDYTTICRRVNKVAIEIKKTLISYKDKEVVVYLDSSGAKVTNRGEWTRQKWKVRRGWIKVHIAVDDQNKQVVGIETIMILIMSIDRSTSGIFSLLAVFFALPEPTASSMIFAIIHFGFSESVLMVISCYYFLI